MQSIEASAGAGQPQSTQQSSRAGNSARVGCNAATVRFGQPQPEARRKPRLKPVDRKQIVFRVVDVEQLVGPTHAVRAIWALVGQLDLSQFEGTIKALEGVPGQARLSPRLLVSLWIYACSRGVSSAREISRLSEYHPAYQWLTGLRSINYHTLAEFRVQHEEALDQLFVEVLGVLSAGNLVKLKRVMHDGTKVQAQAGSDTFRREERLQAHLEVAQRQVEQMGDPRNEAVSQRVARARERAVREKKARLELAAAELEKIRAGKKSEAEKKEARVSLTDPEARIMKQPDGGHAPSYNVQITTDAAAKVIVGVEASQCGSDYPLLGGALEQVQKNLGEKPEQVVVDGGYTSRENIVEMSEQKVDLIGSLGETGARSAAQLARRGVDPAFGPEAFRYDPSRDLYTCPAGKTLGHQSQSQSAGRVDHNYQAKGVDCSGCCYKAKCCPQAAKRSLNRIQEHPAVTAFRGKMATGEAKQIYKQRGPVAEFPNAWIKEKIGLRKFRLRGLRKVNMEAMWACLTYNVQQWIRRIWRPRPVPILEAVA